MHTWPSWAKSFSIAESSYSAKVEPLADDYGNCVHTPKINRSEMTQLGSGREPSFDFTFRRGSMSTTQWE
jgi:hypothetical protein